MELLTFFFSFLVDYNQTNVISEFIVGIIKFINKIVEPQYNCKLDLYSEICGLLGDLYKHFPGSVELYLDSNSLQIISHKLEESPNPEHKEVLNYSKNMMSDLIDNTMI